MQTVDLKMEDSNQPSAIIPVTAAFTACFLGLVAGEASDSSSLRAKV